MECEVQCLCCSLFDNCQVLVRHISMGGNWSKNGRKIEKEIAEEENWDENGRNKGVNCGEIEE